MLNAIINYNLIIAKLSAMYFSSASHKIDRLGDMKNEKWNLTFPF